MNISRISDDTFFGRALRFPLRILPPRMLLPILQGPSRGMLWRVGSSTHGCWLGSYEYEKRKVMEEIVEAGSIFFDLGANVGYYTLVASKLVGRTGHVFAFEPMEAALADLWNHLQLNRISNVSVIDSAVVGSSDGLASKRVLHCYQGRSQTAQLVNVKECTLDTLYHQGQIPLPDYIKMDIEGSELDALNGASHLLDVKGPTIFLSTHGPWIHSACIDFLRSKGYNVTPIVHAELLATKEFKN